MLPLLSGCLADRSEPITAPPQPICPGLVKYTPEQQAKAAAELGILPGDAQVTAMIGDYGTLRDRLRAACPNG